jgi:hypothetical protein
MANITVKKADGTTDVVFVAKMPAAGDKTPARWTVDAASPVPSLRPVMNTTSRPNGDRSARNITTTVKFPDVRTISGVDTVVGNVIVNIEAVVPLNVTSTVTTEAIAQAANLFKATLLQDSYKDGYAPQ